MSARKHTRDQDLAELGLPAGIQDEATIRKKFMREALRRHPDKNPDKDDSTADFQRLSGAYSRLTEGYAYLPSPVQFSNAYASSANAARPRSFGEEEEQQPSEDYDEHWDYGCDCDCGQYSTFFNFFKDFRGDQFYEDGTMDANFEKWEKERSQQRVKERRENIKKHFDYRDSTLVGNDSSDRCDTCKTNAPIEILSALRYGLVWNEYKRHPDRLKTCWACKNAHTSVMTASQAQSKYKVLQRDTGKTVFGRLSNEGKTFHHRPKPGARKSEYFWARDLELPRGRSAGRQSMR
eukprot:gb/GEZN01007935.1/.p1 GENE.gb/GEZN01007935.1/~~gb/GEZN01007935.1/.p1  ORF type:complete len:293 (+),score=35.67 gb/GEZN01007935.1/:190-1068(+)